VDGQLSWAGLPRINLIQEGQKMVNLKILRKRIAITVGLLLVSELLTAAPAFATSEDLTITKVAPSATASDSFPFTVTKGPGGSPSVIYPNGTPSVSFNLDSSNSFTKTFSGFQNASTGVVTPSNNYTITEATPAGWNAPSISCSDTNPNSNAFSNITFNYTSPSVSFEYTPNAMVPGAHINCTFTNTRMTVVTLSTTVSALSIPAGSLGHDSAILSGATGGSLTYNLFAGTCPAQAMNVPIFSSPVSVGSNGSVPDSLSYTFNTAGSYYWVAVYTPASGSPIVTGPCEPLTVTASTTTLTVTKTIVTASGNTDTFTLQVFDSTGHLLANFLNSGNGGVLGPITLSPGSYTVSETGANLSHYTATYSADCFPAGAVTLAAGDHKTCTITNTLMTAVTLSTTVSALTIPVGSLGHDSATLSGATGGSLTYNLFAGTCPAQPMNVPIFTSPVAVGSNSSVPDSLPFTFANVGSFYWVAVYTPASGSPIVTGPCEPLTVTANVAIATTVSALTIPVGSLGHDSATLSGATGGSLTYNLFAGTCPAQAMNVPIFTSPVSVTGSVVPDSLPFTFANAGSFYWVAVYTPASGSPIVTGPCEPLTVTPKLTTATLTVIKRLLPGTNNPNTFNLIIGPTGQLGSGTTSSVGNAGTTGAVTISAGLPYIVSESAGNGSTSLSDYTTTFSGVCAPSGVVSLATNASGLCIISNTKKARLRVIKILIPGNDPGRFDLQINGSTVASNKGNGGSSGFVSVPAGSGNSVGETAGNSVTFLWKYLRTYSPGCAPTFVLAPGATKICIITNKRVHK
jgi:hypothetical protein